MGGASLFLLARLFPNHTGIVRKLHPSRNGELWRGVPLSPLSTAAGGRSPVKNSSEQAELLSASFRPSEMIRSEFGTALVES